MSVPVFFDFFLPLLKIVSDGKGHDWKEVLELVSTKLGLTDEDKQVLIKGKTEPQYVNRTRWARTYLGKAGLIERPERGKIQITKRGLELLKTSPKRITRESLMKYPEFRKFQGIDKIPPGPTPKEHKTPEELIAEAKLVLNSQLESDLLTKIAEKSPSFFEQVVIKLLLAMGYGGSEEDIIQSGGFSGDGGIDGIIKRDILGLDKVYIQAKRWSSKVGSPTVSQFVGSLVHGINTGIFITTSSFTQEAINHFEKTGKTIILIDGTKLARLMVKYNVGVQVKETIQIKKIDEDFFLDEE